MPLFLALVTSVVGKVLCLLQVILELVGDIDGILATTISNLKTFLTGVADGGLGTALSALDVKSVLAAVPQIVDCTVGPLTEITSMPVVGSLLAPLVPTVNALVQTLTKAVQAMA